MWVLQLVAVDVVLLIVWTVMDRPRVVAHTVSVDDVGETPGNGQTRFVVSNLPNYRA